MVNMAFQPETQLKVHAESTDIAAKHMVKDFCTALPEDTPTIYLEKLQRCKKTENTPYVYITDARQKLLGVVSLQKLLISPRDTPLASLMETKLVTVRPHSDRERVALLAIQHKIKAIPVVDMENHFLGVVPENSIYQILHEEHVEDFIRAAGIHHERGSFVDVLRARTSRVFKARIPWLLIGFGGGIAATFVVKFFEASLQERLGLAFFIPIILYMGAAVGVQSETLFLRSEFLGTVDLKKYLFRELQIGPALGLVIGSITFLFAWLLFWEEKLALAIGLAMFVTISISVFVGILIPTILLKLKKDPAAGSGPFATVIQDLLSLIIYFGIATLIL